MGGMHVIAVGNLAGGFTIIGPFATGDEAVEHGNLLDETAIGGIDWIALPLEEPVA